jgi:tetratricopeptide (TPR) repeat protein
MSNLALASLCIAASLAGTPLATRQSAAPQAGPPEEISPVAGTAQEGELTGRDVRRYRTRLAKGSFVHATVLQQGIDVVVTVKGPDGKRVIEVDSPNGAAGPEPVYFVVPTDGEYEVEIRAFAAEAAPGRYALRIETVRPATARDRELVEGLRLHAEASTLRAAFEYVGARRAAERALVLREAALGREHPDVASTYEILGLIYDEIGEFRKGEVAFARALAIYEKASPRDDQAVARASSDLGYLHMAAGSFKEAEAALLRGLEIREKRLSVREAGLAATLHGLAAVYRATGRFDDADRVLRRAISGIEREVGPESGNLVGSLFQLVALHIQRRQIDEAEVVARRTLAIREKLGPPAPRSFAALGLASTVARLGEIAAAKGDYATAESHLARSIAMCETATGPRGVAVSDPLTVLSTVALMKGDFGRAVRLAERAVDIRTKTHGPNHPYTADSMIVLADARAAGREFGRAESLYLRAIAIREAACGSNHATIAAPLESLAKVYEATKRPDRARAVLDRAHSLRASR